MLDEVGRRTPCDSSPMLGFPRTCTEDLEVRRWAVSWWEYSSSSWDKRLKKLIVGVKLPHSKIIQPLKTGKKCCVILGITLNLLLKEQQMSLLSWEEYWDTSLGNYHRANSSTVFGAPQQRAEKQHSTIWRAEPSPASCQCYSLVPCRALEDTNQSILSPPSTRSRSQSPRWRQSRAGEALQTPHQQGTLPEGPDALWAPLPQEINEACPSKPFIKLNLIWCNVHMENKQERKIKTHNISLWSPELNNPR